MLHKIDLPFDDCELKFESSDAEGTFEGYLSVFGRTDSYGDTVHKGAFADTLKNRERPPLMLFNHDSFSQLPIGKWLAMEEDSKGLRVQGQLTPGNSLAQDVRASMKHGAIDGLSIGFRPVESKVKVDDDGNEIGGRDLFKIHLVEGSVVTMPAEDAARIDDVKDEDIGTIETIRDFEYFLRDAGMSRKMAVHLASHIKAMCQSDSDTQPLLDEIAELKARLQRFERFERIEQSRPQKLSLI